MRSRLAIVSLFALGLMAGALLVAFLGIRSLFTAPDPEVVASASLRSIREQARLVPFTARFVSVVTATQTRFGISSRKTLIMPGTVRYELDLTRIRQQDLSWDSGSRTLNVTLPGLDLAGPDVDLTQVREYADGGMIRLAITGGEEQLDQAVRAQSRVELLRQANDPVMMRLARDSARRAIERSFSMPLRAAGVQAEVNVRFADEGVRNDEYIDHSRHPSEVLGERAKQRQQPQPPPPATTPTPQPAR
ncbi:MAG: DUF4230 domain-containing protein [Sphingosinicella sp.]